KTRQMFCWSRGGVTEQAVSSKANSSPPQAVRELFAALRMQVARPVRLELTGAADVQGAPRCARDRAWGELARSRAPAAPLHRQALDCLECLLNVLHRRQAADGLGDLPVRRDNERGPLREAVVDLYAAGILDAFAAGLDVELVRLRDFSVLVRGNRQLAGAIFRIG